MLRYGKITDKNKREIVLLKGYPCVWGQCSFCDYTSDNSMDKHELLSTNREALQNVTGEYAALEVVNSGSVFELPAETLHDIKALAESKGIRRLFFESYFGYRDRLDEIRRFFDAGIVFKCGIETFDATFRNKVLKKGIAISDPLEVAQYFESVCLMAGIQGQTREMIRKDIEILLAHFKYGCVNLYENNTTPVKADEELKKWFKDTYGHLEGHPNIDVLWSNTDFGIGGEAV